MSQILFFGGVTLPVIKKQNEELESTSLKEKINPGRGKKIA
jgi:hypothetical protein